MERFWVGCVSGQVTGFGGQAVFFFCFGLNQWLQYKEIGRWANYASGEKTYLVLSLAAKSRLAWQVFVVSLIT